MVIMNLKQKLLAKRKEKIIADFKNKYPEVYEWFQGDYFSEVMVDNGNICIRWEAETYFNLKDFPVKELPAYDSNGVVNIHEVCVYLNAEGLSRKIEYNDGGSGFTTLEVTLK